MRIAIRVDASIQVGIGHFMRCLTLADALKQRGAQIRFISRLLPQHLQNMLVAKGHQFMSLDRSSIEGISDNLAQSNWLGTSQHADAQDTVQALSDQAWDWLVVDHYALDSRWETALRLTAKNILAIDDLANRQHDCDILLDQNYYHDLSRRYQGLLPERCVNLLGLAYVLLRPEFIEAKQRLRARDGIVQRILVFLGGSDHTNQTQKVVKALKQLNISDIKVDVVVGSANPNRNAIQALCDELPNITFHCQISNMAELICNADLGVGAGGAAMWERCYLGLPTITVVFAANQVRTTEDVADIGAIEYLGWSDSLGSDDYAKAITEMIDNSQRVKQIGDAALGLLKMSSTSVVDAMLSLMQRDAHFYSGRAASSGAA